jgi:hypothetical protein
MSRLRPSVGLAVRVFLLALLALVPLRVLDRGYVPDDDALRHAAKAVSSRAWSEILVLRPEVTMDSHPGWHLLLGLVHQTSGAQPQALVAFSVALGLLAILLPPLLIQKRPEAWAAALLILGLLDPRLLSRFASGRPFLLSAGLLLALLALAPRVTRGLTLGRGLVVLAPAFGLAAFMHPSWHLFLLPVLACLVAGQRRLATILLAALGLGVGLAGLLYGNPVEFIEQSILHTALAMGSPAPPGTLAIEFLPGDGSPLLVLGAVLLWSWRRQRTQPGSVRAVVALAVLGWLLGFLVIRFWSDWGLLALVSWMAFELEQILEQTLAADERKRLLVAAFVGSAVLLSWSAALRPAAQADRPFIALASPFDDSLLPDPGGILYTDDMRVFFQLFFHRPHTSWRYIVGYEPALMPPRDLATFRSILAARTPENFAPWVTKMRPEDRLLVRALDGAPAIPGVTWTAISRTLWSGRVPSPQGP